MTIAVLQIDDLMLGEYVSFTHPYAIISSQHAKQQLQLFYSDTVAGQHPQHIHQKI